MSEEFWQSRAASYRARAVEAEAGVSTLAVEINALSARLAEAERIMADFLRSWDSSFAGENIDPFRMDEVRAFLRGSVNGDATHG